MIKIDHIPGRQENKIVIDYLFATLSAKSTDCILPTSGLSAGHIMYKAALPGTKDTAMLFVFNNRNTIQIAWGSKVPPPKAVSRAQELDMRSGTVGIVRTGSAG